MCKAGADGERREDAAITVKGELRCHPLPVARASEQHALDARRRWRPAQTPFSVRLLQCCSALQIFCNSLTSADVPLLMLEVVRHNSAVHAQWSALQSSCEQLLELLATTCACALADARGRRPLLLLTGPLQLCLWAAVGAVLPRNSRLALPLVAVAKALASMGKSAFFAVSSSAICDELRGDPQALAEAQLTGESYTGLSVVLAPLLSVFLRKRWGHRAPFAVAAVLSGLSTAALSLGLGETLEPASRSKLRAADLNPLTSSTLLLRQCAPVALLAAMYSLQSATRSVDLFLQPFTSRRLGWGRDEVSKLLSFWGFCLFLGSQGVKRLLRSSPAHVVILLGTISSAADFLLRAATKAWWHHPAALVLGMPGISIEASMRGLVSGTASLHCPELGRGSVQAALKTQQALTLALFGSPLFGRAFARWQRRPLGSGLAEHYTLASGASLAAHLVLWAALLRCGAGALAVSPRTRGAASSGQPERCRLLPRSR